MPVLTIPDALKGERLVGPTRVLFVPVTTAVPTHIGSFVPMVGVAGVYAPVPPWKDFGLAADPPSYTRGIEKQGVEYFNVPGVLDEVVSAVNRSATVNIGSISAENAQIWENSPSIDAIAAAAGKSAQRSVKFGTFTQSEEYRVVFLAQRSKGAVLVTEPGGATRGGLVALVLNRCQLGADELEIEFGAEDPISADVAFTLFPEPGQAAGAEHGQWLFENAGTIA